MTDSGRNKDAVRQTAEEIESCVTDSGRNKMPCDGQQEK